MRIRLKKGMSFIAGHLLNNVSPDKTYLLEGKSKTYKYIIDDAGKHTTISNTCKRKYFTEVGL
jgi:hypothetical protein